MQHSLLDKAERFEQAESSDDADSEASDDSLWHLSLYEKNRQPQAPMPDNTQITINSREFDEFKCAICWDLLTHTMTAMECLHRFCSDCISSALRSGNKECPTCRTKLASKRSLRADPNFDTLISAMFPDRGEIDDFHISLLKQLKANDVAKNLAEGMRKQEQARALLSKKRKIDETTDNKPSPDETSSQLSDNVEKAHTGSTCSSASTSKKKSEHKEEKMLRKDNLIAGCSKNFASSTNEDEKSMEKVDKNGMIKCVIKPHPRLRWKDYKMHTRYLLSPGDANIDVFHRYMQLCVEMLDKGELIQDRAEDAKDGIVRYNKRVRLRDFEIFVVTSDGSFVSLPTSMVLSEVLVRYGDRSDNFIRLFYMYADEE